MHPVDSTCSLALFSCEGGHPDEFLDSLICVGIASYMCRLRKKKPTQMQTGFEPWPGSLCPGDVCLGISMVLWLDAAVTTVAVASLKVPGRAGDHSDWQLGMQDVASARRRSDQTNSASS